MIKMFVLIFNDVPIPHLELVKLPKPWTALVPSEWKPVCTIPMDEHGMDFLKTVMRTISDD